MPVASILCVKAACSRMLTASKANDEIAAAAEEEAEAKDKEEKDQRCECKQARRRGRKKLNSQLRCL